MIIVNFKNYKSGENLIDLAKKIYKYDKKSIVCIPALDVKEVVRKTKARVFSQHVDPFGPGRGTGYITIESLKEYGAQGSIINHSEHPLPFNFISKIVERSRIYGFKIIVCVKSLKEAKKVIDLKPWAIAYEDPKLIATGRSIVDHKTEDLEEFISLFKGKKITPVCGAGIGDSKSVWKAYRLGFKGVLISSAIADVRNPDKTLKELKTISSNKKTL